MEENLKAKVADAVGRALDDVNQEVKGKEQAAGKADQGALQNAWEVSYKTSTK